MFGINPRFNPLYQNLLPKFHRPKGDVIGSYEQLFSEKMKQRYGVFFPYGRTALVAILNALDLEDKEIICPAYTCVVVPHAIVYSNNKPVFVDSQSQDFNMDLDEAEKKITPNTGALIATSIFGYPVDLDKLGEIKSKHPHVHIIQDCAHSFSCSWKDQAPVNKEGIAAFYGLNISKIIDSVFGGMVTTDDETFYNKLLAERRNLTHPSSLLKQFKRRIYFYLVLLTFRPFFYYFVYKLTRTPLFSFLVDYYDETEINMPKDYLELPSSFEAKVGISQLSTYKEKIVLHREVANYYDTHIPNSIKYQKPPIIAGATYSHYVLLVPDRDKVKSYFLSRGIELGEIIEYSIPEMKSYQCYSTGDFPNAGKWKSMTINLPMYSLELAKSAVTYLKEYYAV